jgi:hypothetical protein
MAAHNARESGSPSGDDQRDAFFGDRLVLWDELTRAEVAAYKTALDTARDEGDMQRFLEAHPRLLIQHLVAGRRSWVIPKKRLGSEHETDFVVAQQATDGLVWYAVELERPQAKMFNKNGDSSAALNHALRQINDWRDWLSRNLDYASRPSDRSGLNLIDIHPELEGMIIMGRDADFDRRAIAPRRQRLERVHRVKIETYDWLLAQASERLASLEKKALDIVGRNPLLEFLDAAIRSPRTPRPAEKAVREVFGGISSGWTAPTAVRDEIEWEAVEIWFDPDDTGNQVVAALKILHLLWKPQDRPLLAGDWQEWTGHVTGYLDADHSLIVTERAPHEGLQDSLTCEREGIWYASDWFPWYGEQRLAHLHLLVYLPPPASYDEKRSRLATAREVFRRYVPDPTVEKEKEAERAREAKRKIASFSLTPGDMVSHDRFGLGTVITISGDGTEARIDFGVEYGVKHLMLRFAPIAKLLGPQ